MKQNFKERYTSITAYLNSSPDANQGTPLPTVNPLTSSTSKGGLLRSLIENSIVTIIDSIYSLVVGEENRPKPFSFLTKIGDANLRWIYKEVVKDPQSGISIVKSSHKTCLRLLPNMRRMKITKLAVETILQMFGITWVKQRKIELWGWRNRKINKYLESQYRRLYKLRGSKDKLGNTIPPADFANKPKEWINLVARQNKPNTDYWDHALFLMQHSTAFQAVHVNLGIKGWEKNMTLNQLIPIVRDVMKLVATGEWWKLKLHRVWIESNGLRPLGVPKKSHLIIGSMLTNLIEFYLEGSFKYNEGYQAYKGTGTAWKRILSPPDAIINYPYIWETDIKGFFNNVSHWTVYSLLKATGIPPWVTLRILRMQQTAPILTEEALNSEDNRPTNKDFPSMRIRRSDVGGKSGIALTDTVKGSNKVMNYLGDFNYRGVAQGHNLSPLISILVLEHVLRTYVAHQKDKTGAKPLAYADDLIIYSPTLPDVTRFQRLLENIANCTISPDKTFWIRKEFIWLRPLKFLGLQYNPENTTLQSYTRKQKKTKKFTILDRSLTDFFSNGKYLETASDWLLMEPYRLGEPIIHGFKEGSIPTDLTRLVKNFYEWFDKFIHKHSPDIFFQHVYDKEYKRKVIIKENSELLLLYLPIITLAGITTNLPDLVISIIIVILLIIFIYWLSPYAPTLPQLKEWWEMHEIQAISYCITWRSVIKAGYLNKFIAKLYNGSLEDIKIEQDFKLRPTHGSLIWFLKSQHLLPDERLKKQIPKLDPKTGKYTDRATIIYWNKLKDKWKELPLTDRIKLILAERGGTLPFLQEDLDSPLTVFNSSTVGTYFLQHIIDEAKSGIKFESSKKLHWRMMELMNMKGVFHEIRPSDKPLGVIHSDVLSRAIRTYDKMFKAALFHPSKWKKLQTIKLPRRLGNLLFKRTTTELYKLIDWHDATVASRFQNTGGDRQRRLWNYWSFTTDEYVRVYKTYRGYLDLLSGTANESTHRYLGFVPVRPFKKSLSKKINPQSMTERPILKVNDHLETEYRSVSVGGIPPKRTTFKSWRKSLRKPFES